MELKWYLQVLWRRWPAVVILPLLVAAFAIYQDTTRTEQYSANARLAVVRMPDGEPTGDFRYDEYYNFLTSEFNIDDLVETVRGNVFARAVAERMNDAGIDIGAGEVQGAIASDRQHRILSVTTSTSDPERTLAISQGVVEELEARPELYVDVHTEGAGASVRAIQIPEGASPDSTRAQLMLALMVMVSVGAGVLLAFVVDYLDDTLYEAETTAAVLDLPVLAHVPTERGP